VIFETGRPSGSCDRTEIALDGNVRGRCPRGVRGV